MPNRRAVGLAAVPLAIVVFHGLAGAQSTPVTIASADGFPLAARYYSPARPGPGVLLLHQCDRDGPRTGYEELAAQLVHHGLHVLELDFRGFGDSRSDQYPEFRSNMRSIAPLMPSDASAALEYMRARDDVRADRIGVVGASCGASQAIFLAEARPSIKSLVFLSGSLWPGAREAFTSLQRLPLLIATSEDDPVTASMVELFSSSESATSRLLTYKGSLHGAPLLAHDPALMSTIVQWFRRTLSDSVDP